MVREAPSEVVTFKLRFSDKKDRHLKFKRGVFDVKGIVSAEARGHQGTEVHEEGGPAASVSEWAQEWTW